MAGGTKRQPLAVPSQALREPDLGTQKIVPPCIPLSEGFEELDSNEAGLPPRKMRPRGCLGFGPADMHLPIQPLRNGKSWTGYEPSVSGGKGRRKMGQD